ncbi:MAG TPA: gliding motility-associated C-terminal domain-containing protein, partial [Flavobacteriales bacterium]|nr:gliding motility-associated C-terminal domain-containing protein [Flavobacteriales bacterium]
PDQTICGTTATLAGNAATGTGVGTWTVISGGATVTSVNSATSGVTGLSTGVNTFVWTIVDGSCPSTSDTITITGEVPPTTANAGPDQVVCDSTTTATVMANLPTLGTGLWTIATGTATITDALNDTTTVTGITSTVTLTWTITGTGICPPSSDNVTLAVESCVDVAPPSGFTPDGDGTNDTWDIPGLANYPECKVEIFTRWGAKIFVSDTGYTIPWDGNYNNNPMPLGSYYFVIYFNDGATDPMKGNVTIIR